MMEIGQVNWKIILLEGVVLTILGLVALLQPFVMAVSLEFFLGSLLIIVGLVQGFRALTHLKEESSVPLLIGAGFALVAGILLLAYPLTGVITLTLLLTVFFFVDGIAKIINSWQYRPLKGWGWLLFSGIVSVALAVLITMGLPTSAVWVIGIYLGVYFLFVGFSLITLAFYVRKGAFN